MGCGVCVRTCVPKSLAGNMGERKKSAQIIHYTAKLRIPTERRQRSPKEGTQSNGCQRSRFFSIPAPWPWDKVDTARREGREKGLLFSNGIASA